LPRGIIEHVDASEHQREDIDHPHLDGVRAGQHGEGGGQQPRTRNDWATVCIHVPATETSWPEK